MTAPLRVAVVGAGWAGLSAAVAATRAGHHVTLFETARQAGGRARSLPDGDLDNGQHILIGAYRETLALMEAVGADPQALLQRRALALRMADGRALELRGGPPALAFAGAVLRCRAWRWSERAALLTACAGWAWQGFRCAPDRSVAELCAALPRAVRALFVDPLCVAALNTPSVDASAAVFLRVLRDGVFGGRGACDLLLPQRPLRALLPEPALQWLQSRGAELRLGHRVMALNPRENGFEVGGTLADAVVLACTAAEAARLSEPWSPDWSQCARALRFEPIVTVYLRHPDLCLPLPMLGLVEDERSPAQFVFDHGALEGRPGRFAFVLSGASRWVAAGQVATVEAVLEQAARQLAPLGWQAAQASVEQVVAERRATFICGPALKRPPTRVFAGVVAAGDYVEGPYPATLEGAVRSGIAAVAALSP